MKISQYNWGWWFVINALILVTLCDVSMINMKFTPTQETIYNVSWFMWLVSMIICLYIGCKPVVHEEKD